MRGALGLQRVTASSAPATTVMVCGVTPVQRARLADALRGRAVLREADRFLHLTHALRSTIEHVDAIVLGTRDATGADAAATVRVIAADRPRTAIIAYCQAGVQHSTDIRALATAGVHQFVFAGIDDNGVAFRAVLDAARRQCAAEFIMQRIARLLPPSVQPMAEAVLARPDVITSVSALANAMSVHRKTLFNRCHQASFLPPAELMTWARLALVGFYLDNTGCTIETIAAELSFASDTALRNTIKRYVGRRATEIRQTGAFQAVVASFAERITIGRPPSRETSLHLV